MNHPVNKPLRIAIATLGRFHVLDLARELEALGHQVRFYSYVPRKRAIKFGLPEKCHVALLPWLAPFLLLTTLMGRLGFRNAGDRIMYHAADRLVAWLLEPCDVFIAMSGVYVQAFKAADRRYGAKRVIERGSVHIEAQLEILQQLSTLNPAVQGVPKFAVERELKGYALAERIAVPSIHVEKSFIARGVSARKLFRNPYGVDLRMFSPDVTVQRDPGLILFVGAWSYRKGVDVLLEAMDSLSPRNYRLRHIGNVVDASLPDMAWFESIGQVDQPQLAEHYRTAGCLALPSREEGIALVQLQALACGCPLVGSTMSGARDLQGLLGPAAPIEVVPADDVQALIAAVISSSGKVDSQLLNAEQRSNLSWAAYARRYEGMLLKIVAGET